MFALHCSICFLYIYILYLSSLSVSHPLFFLYPPLSLSRSLLNSPLMQGEVGLVDLQVYLTPKLTSTPPKSLVKVRVEIKKKKLVQFQWLRSLGNYPAENMALYERRRISISYPPKHTHKHARTLSQSTDELTTGEQFCFCKQTFFTNCKYGM